MIMGDLFIYYLFKPRGAVAFVMENKIINEK